MSPVAFRCRPPTRGARIETLRNRPGWVGVGVAPLRGGRGLKQRMPWWLIHTWGRPPTRGARIETRRVVCAANRNRVAPLRGGRGLKPSAECVVGDGGRSPPYAGGAD